MANVPDITRLVFSATTDPVTNAPVLNFELELSDNFSKLQTVDLLYWYVNNRQTYVTLQRGTDGVFRYSEHLNANAASGEYEIRLINTTDDQGQLVQFSTSQLRNEFGLTTSITLENPNADNDRPVIQSFSFGELLQTEAGYELSFEGLATDNGSGLLDSVIVEVFSPTDTSLQTRVDLQADGRFSGLLRLSKFAASGEYHVRTLRLEDKAGNLNFSQEWLNDNPKTFNLQNPESDTTPPSFQDLQIGAAFDATGRPSLVFRGEITDRSSTFQDIYFRFLSPDGTTILDARPSATMPLEGQTGVSFEGQIALTSNFKEGEYTLQWTFIVDEASNRAEFFEGDLRQASFDTRVNVFFQQSENDTNILGSERNDYVFGGQLTSDTLVAAGGNDSLFAGDGNDILNGGTGADWMEGGEGSDIYIVDNVLDVVMEVAVDAADTVMSSVSYTLSDNLENLTLTGNRNRNGAGNELSNTLNGNTGSNILSGGEGEDSIFAGAGNDMLDGGTGSDWMEGGTGNDTYIVDSASDVAMEQADGGIDTVRSSVNMSLEANLENLILTGAAIEGTGNELSNALVGNASANKLSAGAGDDMLNGGRGADTMMGGADNDTYIVDSRGDRVMEAVNEGTDTVMSSVSFTLTDALENLVLTGTASNNATGNAADNMLWGNSGNNALSGGDGADSLLAGAGNDVLNGGTGADWMEGGDGNDTYAVDNAQDVTMELSGKGVDTVRASVSYLLGDNLENLILTGGRSLNGTGNALGNSLSGNSGKNALSGGDGNDTLTGGSGADSLQGGNGNDMFDYNAVTDSGVTAATMDTIADFTRGADKIDLSTIDADVAVSGNQTFVFIGTNEFSSTDASGQLRYVYDRESNAGILCGSNDADSDAEFVIKIVGVDSFSDSAFIL